jgi:hypothetical protein
MATRIGILGVLYAYVLLNTVACLGDVSKSGLEVPNHQAIGRGISRKIDARQTLQPKSIMDVAKKQRFRQKMQTNTKGDDKSMSLRLDNYARGRPATVTGTDFLGIGYDLVKGNPDGDGETILDPGYRAMVIQVEAFNLQRVTPEYFYMPENGFALKEDACEQASTTVKLTTSDDYKNTLNADVSAEGAGSSGLYSAAFSASVKYKEFQQNVVEKEATQYDMTSYCMSGHLGFYEDEYPMPTKEFADATNKLPSTMSPEGQKCLETVSPLSGETVECVHIYNQKYQSYIYVAGGGKLTIVSSEEVKTEEATDKCLWQYDQTARTLRHHKSGKYLVLLKGTGNEVGKMGKASAVDTIGGGDQLPGGWIPKSARHWVFDPVLDSNELMKKADSNSTDPATQPTDAQPALLEEELHLQKSHAASKQHTSHVATKQHARAAGGDSGKYQIKDKATSQWARLDDDGWLKGTPNQHAATWFIDNGAGIKVKSGKWASNHWLASHYDKGVGAYTDGGKGDFNWVTDGGSLRLQVMNHRSTGSFLSYRQSDQSFWFYNEGSDYAKVDVQRVYEIKDTPSTPTADTKGLSDQSYQIKDTYGGTEKWLSIGEDGWLYGVPDKAKATWFSDEPVNGKPGEVKININGKGIYAGYALATHYNKGVGAYDGSDWGPFQWEEINGPVGDESATMKLTSRGHRTDGQMLSYEPEASQFWCHQANGYATSRLHKVYDAEAPPISKSKTSDVPRPDSIFLRFEMKHSGDKMVFVEDSVGWFKRLGTEKTTTTRNGKVENLFVTDPAYENVNELVVYHAPDHVKDAWFDLFKTFGTHYVDDLHVGGKMIISTTISKESMKQVKESGLDVRAELTAKYGPATAGSEAKASAGSESGSESMSSSLNDLTETRVSMLGGQVPDVADTASMFNEWSAQIGAWHETNTYTMPVKIGVKELPRALMGCAQDSSKSVTALGETYTCKPMDKRSYKKMALLYTMQESMLAQQSLLTAINSAVLSELKPGWSISNEGHNNFMQSTDGSVKLIIRVSPGSHMQSNSSGQHEGATPVTVKETAACLLVPHLQKAY